MFSRANQANVGGVVSPAAGAHEKDQTPDTVDLAYVLLALIMLLCIIIMCFVLALMVCSAAIPFYF
jgi:flagellar biogenesis protein FliO